MSHGDSRNLVLTGFMGTGKTQVGKRVARQLARPFIDMDAAIETRVGKPVRQVFAEDGEQAFRTMEADLCRELGSQSGLVIATGGGALMNPASRTAMQRQGTILCLTASVDEILRRLNRGSRGIRPLLNVPDPRAEIERLLAARQDAYAAIPWQIDTTNQTLSEVVKQVIAFDGVATLFARYPGGEYPIHVGQGLLDRVGDALRAAGAPRGSRVAVVTNSVVSALYASRVEEAVRCAGFEPTLCTIPDGEQHKTLDTVAMLYAEFLANHLDRSSTVLSLGGGVTGDIAGFAAATFMRGIRFAQTPTTLLSMADASVGGKTGVDLPEGKNLVGAFKQPIMVLIDPAVLTTLPEEEMRSGMAEVIKHGLLSDPELFTSLESMPSDLHSALTTNQLVRTLQVKIDVVEQDPLETGRRATLNLGHTVGHALERLSKFTMRHGEGVSIGTAAAARIAVELGVAQPVVSQRTENTLSRWGLPVRCPPYQIDAIWQAMTHDKKRHGISLRWVLPVAIGQTIITDGVPQAVVESVLLELGARKGS